MSLSINKVMLYGNLTKNPEMRTTQGGHSVVSFTIATNRTYKDKDGTKKDDAQFHSCVAWGKTAELINQYCGKGSPLWVDGRLQTRTYEAKDGSKRYVTEVVVENMQFGPKKQETSRSDENFEPRNDAEEESQPAVDPKDLPF